jgi:hypothetical protein
VKDLYDANCKTIPFAKWVRRGLRSSHFMKWAGLISAVTKLKGKLEVCERSTDTQFVMQVMQYVTFVAKERKTLYTYSGTVYT